MEDKAILKAVTDTLRMYEGMLDGSVSFDEWENTNCRVCAALHEEVSGSCSMCPIKNDSNTILSCGFNRQGKAGLGSKYYIHYEFYRSCGKYKQAVRARYRELLRRLKVNGYEYK